MTAYLAISIDRATSMIVGVAIWSHAASTCMGSSFHTTPHGWTSDGATLDEATDRLRDRLAENATFWGRDGTPLREAMDRLAATGEAQAVR